MFCYNEKYVNWVKFFIYKNGFAVIWRGMEGEHTIKFVTLEGD